MSFKLNSDTILRGFLAHVASNLRELARLRGAAEMHPYNTPEKSMERAAGSKSHEVCEMWESLRTDLAKVLDLHLLPAAQIQISAGDVYVMDPANCGKDTSRITFRELKKQADKARRKDPSISLLRSWDAVAKDKEADDALQARYDAGEQLDEKQEARLRRRRWAKTS